MFNYLCPGITSSFLRIYKTTRGPNINICGRLNGSVSNSDYIVQNDRIISEYYIGRNLRWDFCCLICGAIPTFAWRKEGIPPKNFNQGSRFLGRCLYPVAQEYEGALLHPPPPPLCLDLRVESIVSVVYRNCDQTTRNGLACTDASRGAISGTACCQNFREHKVKSPSEFNVGTAFVMKGVVSPEQVGAVITP
jgi:hypothetical protein